MRTSGHSSDDTLDGWMVHSQAALFAHRYRLCCDVLVVVCCCDLMYRTQEGGEVEDEGGQEASEGKQEGKQEGGLETRQTERRKDDRVCDCSDRTAVSRVDEQTLIAALRSPLTPLDDGSASAITMFIVLQQSVKVESL